jgi:dTMP kinase
VVLGNQGRFISVEGGEGVGKSLFISLFTKRLNAQGILHALTREPGGTGIADRIREIFANPPAGEQLTTSAELMLVSAARSQHTTLFIRPKLLERVWVISDRFADSSRVYQGIVGGISSDFVESVVQQTTGGLEPDLTFVLDCPVDVSLRRIQGRAASGQDGAHRYDGAKLEVHKLIREGFLAIGEKFPKRIRILNAARRPEEVADEAIAIVKELFLAKAP